MKLYKLTCNHCKKTFEEDSRKYKRRLWHLKKGTTKNVYCSMKCSGAAKYVGKEEIRKRHSLYLKEKMANDPIFRAKRLANKKELYEKNKIEIEKRMKEKRATLEYKEFRREYLSSKKYKTYKHKYDRVHRCKKKYGQFWEAASILIDLDNEIKKHATKEEIRVTNGTYNKAQFRSRNEGIKRSYT